MAVNRKFLMCIAEFSHNFIYPATAENEFRIFSIIEIKNVGQGHISSISPITLFDGKYQNLQT